MKRLVALLKRIGAKVYRLRIITYPRRMQHVIASTLELKRDRRCLEQKFPLFRNFDQLANNRRQKLQPYYEEYISRMSSADMAISFELSVLLLTMCDILKPKAILDLGSGFSSFVFRYYMLNSAQKPVIWSIDDSLEWLEKTGTFLAAHNLPTENLSTWPMFAQANRDTFDLILHDLGNRMEVRRDMLKDVLRLARPGGIIVLDDMHKKHYGPYVKQVLDESNYKYYSLKSYTMDKLGRYSVLVIS